MWSSWGMNSYLFFHADLFNDLLFSSSYLSSLTPCRNLSCRNLMCHCELLSTEVFLMSFQLSLLNICSPQYLLSVNVSWVTYIKETKDFNRTPIFLWKYLVFHKIFCKMWSIIQMHYFLFYYLKMIIIDLKWWGKWTH